MHGIFSNSKKYYIVKVTVNLCLLSNNTNYTCCFKAPVQY